MLDSIIRSVESTFIQFSFRRLLYIVFLFSVFILSLYIFDERTGYTKFTKIEKELSALERLHSLENNQIKISQDLAPVYDSILTELKRPSPRLFSFNISSEPIIKFFAASLLPFIFIIISAVNLLRKVPEAGSTFVGSFVITLILGIPAVLIPTIINLWVTVGIYSMVQLILMLLAARYGKANN